MTTWDDAFLDVALRTQADPDARTRSSPGSSPGTEG